MTNRFGTVRRGAGLLVVAAMVGACGSDEGEGAGGDDVVIEATPAFLSEAAQRSEESSRRMEMTVSVDGGEPVPMVTAEVDGDRSHVEMDMGELTATLAEQAGEPTQGFPVDDMTMEIVGDGDVLYLRTPIFAMVEDQEPGALGEIGPALAELRDQWGRVDMAALGDVVPADVQEAVTGQGGDPSAFFDLVANAEGVEDLGEDEVDGDAVTGLSADVPYADMLASSGTDADALAEAMPGEGAEAVQSALADLTLPMEVWVDDEGLVRRMGYSLDMGELVEALDIPADEVPEDEMFAVDYTVDVFDYGADDIEVTVPEDATDISEAFARLMAS